MTTEKKQCSKMILIAVIGGNRQCLNNAKVERDGKLYCHIHDPEYIKTKRNSQYARWDEVIYPSEVCLRIYIYHEISVAEEKGG